MAAVDPLVTRIDELDRALAVPWQGKERAWIETLRGALRGVETALGKQPAPTAQAALAPAAQVDHKISPGLTRETGALRKDHNALLRDLDSLSVQLQRDVLHTSDFATLHQTGVDLVKDLRAFNTADNALFLETVMGEPGAGD